MFIIMTIADDNPMHICEEVMEALIDYMPQDSQFYRCVTISMK